MRGALYQVTMAAESLRNVGDWKDISYLEAIVRAYVNGEPAPVLLSSGLEDYFLGTYYFNRGLYANALAGLTHFDAEKNAFRRTGSTTTTPSSSGRACG